MHQICYNKTNPEREERIAMNKITLGLPPHCHKVSCDGRMIKIKDSGNNKWAFPLSGTENAVVDQVNEETGLLTIHGKDKILAKLEMPIRFCEVGRGWFLDKLPKKKRIKY
jgi:hypothetical protein